LILGLNCINDFRKGYKKKDKIEVALTLPKYIDAGAYQDTLHLIESPPSLKIPTSAKRVSGPVGMSYVIAAHHVHSQFTDEEMQEALQRFLKRKICEMVGKGYYEDLAHWLKIAYFNETENPLAPKQALLKMYDYLIDVEYPGDA